MNLLQYKGFLIILCLNIAILTGFTAIASTVVPPTPLLEDLEVYYLVGLSEVKLGITDFYSHIEPITDEDGFAPTVYCEGRFAVYLKGKIKGKYLITAQLDTMGSNLQEIFNLLERKSGNAIEPEKYYPLYGDQSTLENDVSTQGRVYLLIQENDSTILWGNYQINLNPTVLTAYNRSLYGLKGDFQGAESGLIFFVSTPDTLYSVDRMRSNGSSVYYLKHAKVLQGTETITLEMRDHTTGGVLRSILLQNGRDYRLDYLLGRLYLLRDLEQIDSSSVLHNSIHLTNEIILVAEYEYKPETLPRNASRGLRISGKDEQIDAGASYLSEEKTDGQLYELFGMDVNYQPNDNLAFKAEWGHSNNLPAQINYSDTGGLTYRTIPISSKSDIRYALQLRLDLTLPDPLPHVKEIHLTGDHQYQQKGFASITQQAQNERRVTNIDLQSLLFDQYQLDSKLMIKREESGVNVDFTSMQVTRDYEKFAIASSLRYQKLREPGLKDFQDILGGLRVDYNYSNDQRYFLSQQFTIVKNGSTPYNHRTMVGAEVEVWDQLKVKTNVSVGNLGDLARVRAQYQLTGENELFIEGQTVRDYFGGQTARLLLGSNTHWLRDLNLNIEHQNVRGTYVDAAAFLASIQYNFKQNWQVGLDYTQSDFTKKMERPYDRYASMQIDGYSKTLFEELEIDEIGVYNRHALSTGVGYNTADLNYFTKLQLGKVNGEDQLVQYLLKNHFQWQPSPVLTVQADFDGTVTVDQEKGVDQARSVEGNLGFAYRPIVLDRLNLLGKYSYTDRLSPTNQQDGNTPDEKSSIFMLEGIFDLTDCVQVSEKAALKSMSARSDRAQGQWIASNTYLWINRLTYEFYTDWELYGEYRILWNTLAKDRKQGVLLGVNYELDQNTELSFGYNFTDFTDDLTDLNERARGLFINMINKW